AWRTGVLLTRGDTELLVEVTTRNDDIVLRSRGPERKELLSAVAADLDELNGTYGNLRRDNRVHLRIPCICPGCNQQVDPHLYDHRELVDRKTNPNAGDTVNCSKHYNDIAIIELLDGIHLPTTPPATGRPDHPDPDGPGTIHAPGGVIQINYGNNSTPSVVSTNQTQTEPLTAKADTNQPQPDPWNRVAVIAGLTAAGIAALLWIAPSAWSRFAIATIGGSGLLVGLFVLGRNPKRIYRRLLAGWISAGVAINTIGFLIDGVITRDDTNVNFTFSADVAWWWWIIWTIISLSLITADITTNKTSPPTSP
ncbi:MAG: hypothetical protein GY926_14820, partial [bacterium]|nr:hypothetical protein [bacterium]